MDIYTEGLPALVHGIKGIISVGSGGHGGSALAFNDQFGNTTSIGGAGGRSVLTLDGGTYPPGVHPAWDHIINSTDRSHGGNGGPAMSYPLVDCLPPLPPIATMCGSIVETVHCTVDRVCRPLSTTNETCGAVDPTCEGVDPPGWPCFGDDGPSRAATGTDGDDPGPPSDGDDGGDGSGWSAGCGVNPYPSCGAAVSCTGANTPAKPGGTGFPGNNGGMAKAEGGGGEPGLIKGGDGGSASATGGQGGLGGTGGKGGDGDASDFCPQTEDPKKGGQGGQGGTGGQGKAKGGNGGASYVLPGRGGDAQAKSGDGGEGGPGGPGGNGYVQCARISATCYQSCGKPGGAGGQGGTTQDGSATGGSSGGALGGSLPPIPIVWDGTAAAAPGIDKTSTHGPPGAHGQRVC